MSLHEFCEELEVLLENSPYALEIINNLKEKENEHIPYLCQSPQLEFRYQLINKMRNYCYEVKLSVITMHLAVHLLDYFMDNYSIVREKLKFVAFVCISLSAKFEGDESFRTSHLKRLNKNKDCGAEFLVLELKILGFFNWNLSQPTVAYFLEFYRWLSVFRQDCINVSPNNLRKEAFNIIAKIQDTTLDDHRMNKFKPSLVAACCIFSTREVLKLCPKWPIVLENITGYAEDDFNSCYNLLKSIYILRYNCDYRFSEEGNSDCTTSEDS